MLVKYIDSNALESHNHLVVGKEYQVYGIHFDEGDISYEVLANIFDTYTIEVSANYFKVLDNRLSQFFVLGSAYTKNHMNDPSARQVPFITFKEWADDKHFFEKLVNGDKEVQKIFSQYKELLELEYRNPSIAQIANYMSENWVQCPVCAEAWKLSYPTLEMCKCIKCETVLLNPLFFPLSSS